MDMETRDVWPNAPLVLVSTEVRFAGSATAPLMADTQFGIGEVLGDDWVVETRNEQAVELRFGPDGFQEQNMNDDQVTHITLRDRTRVVTLREDSLTIEASSYRGYADFRSLLEHTFDAVMATVQPKGFSRLGMRYIDEIRVSESDAPVQWQNWLDKALIAPGLGGRDPRNWTGAVQYETGEDKMMVLRYGTADGPVITPSSPIKLANTVDPGPRFVLDFDSFWVPAGIPSFKTTDLVAACDQLQKPARQLFDLLISKRLITEVFEKEREDDA